MAIGFLKLRSLKLGKMTQKKKFQELRTISVDGFMTYGEWENGQRFADFGSCEDVEMEPYCMKAKVQVMRDGNMYVSELPKRIRNRAIFRDDNCSLSLGRNGKYYFVFSLPQEMVKELPLRLVRQASAIAQKMIRRLMVED